MSMKQDLLEVLRFRPLRLLALTVLIVGLGAECFVTKLPVRDLDLWWHLAVGDWIIQHRAVPHNGIFSRTAADRPWMAYSWGFEVPLALSYSWLGFLGVGLYGTGLTIAVAIALFWMVYKLSGRFWVAWMLSIIVYSAFLFNIMPRPVFFTMLMYTITLTLLLEASRTGRERLLYWLPLVFLVWANSHIQFIYGLFTVGLFAGINLLQRLLESWRLRTDFLSSPTLPLSTVMIVLACCIGTTCVGPYSFHLYGVVFGYSSSKIIYTMISELQALNFTGPSHYLEFLLAAGAFFALGWHKKLDPFKVALLVAASVFAFRATRDAWFLCITAAAIIADVPMSEHERDEPLRLVESGGVGLAAVVLLFLVASNTDFNPRGLDRVISGEFPVDAVNFLRKHPVGGPLFNTFDWGGFLIFYMPQYPVAIDGRGDLYGDALVKQFYASETGEPSYATDPHLDEAGVVILRNTVPLARLLPTDHRFRVIYRDDLAVVLAHN